MDKGFDSECILGSNFDPKGYLSLISKIDFEDADWPLMTYSSKEVYFKQNKSKHFEECFWKEIFNPVHFLTVDDPSEFDSSMHVLFVLHSFPVGNGDESVFKAVATSEEFLREDPRYAINFRYNGFPGERRGQVSYPQCDFWKDFDMSLRGYEKDIFPIPTKNWRKRFILKKFFGES